MNILKEYLREIGEYDLLSADKELELAYQMRSENPDEVEYAREMLINSNLRLVVSIAKNYKNARLSLMDLITAGNLGLITAVSKYNPDLGYRFSTCATPWIKQAIFKALNDNGRMIRLPAHIYQLMKKYKDFIDDSVAAGKGVPTEQEIIDYLNIDEDKLNLLRRNRYDAASLDTALSDEEDSDTMAELIPDENQCDAYEFTEQQIARNDLYRALSTLPERTQKIIKMRYGVGVEGDPDEFFDEHTLDEVGKYIGLSRERVRQIVNEALQKLKAMLA